MRYKSLLYLRAGAIFTRSFARGSGLQRGERAGSSVVEGRGRERGFVRLASGRKRKFENSPSPPSWFPGANDTSSFINGVRVAALDLIYACI